jgi:hypothetical protein
MTAPTGQLRESRLVQHPFRSGSEGNKEEFELTQLRMAKKVRALREHRARRPQKDEGKLLADLTFGTRPTHLVAFGRLLQAQCVGRSISARDVEYLSQYIDEVVAREPLEVCHQAIVSASSPSAGKAT